MLSLNAVPVIRTFCIAAAAAITSFALPAQEAFPKRTVTLVVPYAAGGVTDHFARVLGNKLSKTWGQAVVVDNRAGGGTVIGTQLVSKAAPDGHTLLFTSYGFTANSVLRKDLPYTPADFRPVALLGASHNVLLVTNRLKNKSLQAVIADAKAQPGSLKMGSSGLASSPHIGAEFFAKLTGIDFTHVPYRGQGPAMADLTAGVVDAMFDGMSSYAQVKGGVVGAMAIAALQRHPGAPEIPTFRELGVDLVTGTWFGMLAPAGVPGHVINKINADMRLALQDEETRAQITKTGMSVAMSTPEAFGEFLQQEATKLEKLVHQGAKIDLN